MKVAIIGAGLSGLSCAHELEKHGVWPVIYEKNGFIGDQITHASVLLEIMERPIKDLIDYIGAEYSIKIKPISTLNLITHHSPNKTVGINGKLGYFIKRGNDKDGIVNQIFSQLKNSEFKLNSSPNLEKLSKSYDHIIIANGDASYPEMLGCWQSWMNTQLKGAVILGNFNPNELIVWINKNYCKRGYAYLTPLSDKRASLTLVVSDVNSLEVDYFWELFIATENIRYPVIEEFKLEHKSGFVYPLTVENKIFIGNAAGAIEPFLGFGQFSSITMGVMAARSIIFHKDYAKLLKKVKEKKFQMLQFRKAFDMLNNTGYDMVISSLGIPGLKHLAYYTPVNVVKYGAAFLKILPTKLP